MNKNIAIPISGPSVNKTSRFKPFKYKPLFEIEKDQKIETKKWVYCGRIVKFCLRFLIFLFGTLLLFTIFNNQNKIYLDGDSKEEEMRLFGGTTVSSRIQIFLSHITFIIYFKNFNPIAHMRINSN